MSDTTNTVYFFNSENGEIYRSQEELPKKKSHLYLVINRENLYFGSFPIDTKKRLKDTDILNIQGHFIPYKDQFTNIIYNTDRKGTLEKRFFFWIGPPLAGNEVESYFYDEIPESLIFKGDPEEIKNYTLFVFTRAGGYEIIYFNGEDFYSLFEKELPAIQEKIILLARKYSFSPSTGFEVLTDVRFPTEALMQESTLPDVPDVPDVHNDRDVRDVRNDRDVNDAPARSELNDGDAPTHNIRLHLLNAKDTPCFFLPDYVPVKKKFSNLSQNKQLKSIKDIIGLWNRNLNIIAALLLIVVLIEGIAFFVLNKDNNHFKKQSKTISQMLDKSDAIEYRLNKLKKKLAVYPDHMLYLKTVAESMDEEAVLIGYNIGDGRITLEGYSSDSLAFLSLLRKSGHFKEVKFKTAVTKNAYSKREKFEIDILLLEGGVTPPTQSTAEKPTAEKSTTEKSTTEKITPEKNSSGKPPTKKPAKKSAKKPAKKPDKKPVKKPVKKPGKKPVSKRKPAKGARNG